MVLLASFVLSCSPAKAPRQISPPPPMAREFRGAWVATVANIDWPSRPGLPAQQLKDELIRIFDESVKLKLNAIVFQVRPSADAFYASKLEPWSEYLTGVQGNPPSPYFDPLEFAVEEAHRHGLELHCWFNPYRAGHPIQKGPMASSHISRTHPGVVKQYGKFLWMDPGEPEVQKHSLAVVRDVVKRYDIDGVHIDDYFYPYPEGGKDFPDEPSYSRYRAGGGTLARADWRRQNVDQFVHSLYTTIKAVKPWVKFGISPFGIYRPGVPESIKAGVDQYSELYADCKKWLNNGWCDYFSPQLYWPISQKAQSFPVLLDWWSTQNSKGRHVWPGLYTSRVGGDEGKTWQLQEILDQIQLTRDKGVGGVVHFSMKAFLENQQGIASNLSAGLYRDRVLIPSSPWLGNESVEMPKASLKVGQDGHWIVTIEAKNRSRVRFFTIHVLRHGQWLMPRVTSQDHWPLSDVPEAVAVTAVDRVGNESLPVIVEPTG